MDTIEVPETIPVGVEERDGVYLVYNGGFPPGPLRSTERGMVGIEAFEGDGGRRHGLGRTRSVCWASGDILWNADRNAEEAAAPGGGASNSVIGSLDPSGGHHHVNRSRLVSRKYAQGRV